MASSYAFKYIAFLKNGQTKSRIRAKGPILGFDFVVEFELPKPETLALKPLVRTGLTGHRTQVHRYLAADLGPN